MDDTPLQTKRSTKKDTRQELLVSVPCTTQHRHGRVAPTNAVTRCVDA